MNKQTTLKNRTSKNARRQIERIIDARVTTIGKDTTRSITTSSILSSPYSASNISAQGIYEVIGFLQQEIQRIVPPWIKGTGGDIIPDPDNAKGVIVQRFNSGSGVIGGGKLFTLEEDVKIDFFDHLCNYPSTPTTAHVAHFYIMLSDAGVVMALRPNTQYGMLGKVVIPLEKSEFIQKDNPEWENWKKYLNNTDSETPLEYNYNAYIVSARDPYFYNDVAEIGDDAFEKQLWTSLQKLPIEMIIGDKLVIGDNITLSNEFGTVNLGTQGMYFYGPEKDEDGNILNTDEVIAQFATDKAFIGNIEINKTDIRSRNFTPGLTGDGFIIYADGTAAFNDVLVKGTLYAVDGRIGMTTPSSGGWVIDSGKISALDGLTEVISIDADNQAIWFNDSTWQNEGIQIEYNSGTPRFYAGDGGDNYIEWNGTSLVVQGTLYAETGWIGGVGGWAIGEGAILSASASNYSIGLVTEAFSGFSDRMIFIRGNSSNGLPSFGDAGIQLYHDVAGGLSKMYVGDGADNYFQWTGAAVQYQGWINATGGWFGGSGGWAIGEGAILSASDSNYSIGLITEAFSGFSDRMIFIRGNSSSGLPSFGDSGIQLYHDVGSSLAKFYVGDGSNKYVEWNGSSLEVQGIIKATTGWFGGSGGWAVGTGAILSASDTSFSIGLVTETFSGFSDRMIFVRGSSGSGLPSFGDDGIQLYHDISAGQSKIYVGDGADNYFKWDGGTNPVEWRGTVYGEVGWFGGPTGWIIQEGSILSGAATNFSMGLVTEGHASYSNRIFFVKETDGSGIPSFGDAGIQFIQNRTSNTVEMHIGDVYSGGSNYLHYTSAGGLEIAGSLTVTEVGKWVINGDVLEAQNGVGTPIMALVSDGNAGTPNPEIWVMDSTFGNQGIQIQYNSGAPRFYAGDGSNKYMKFDGTNFSFKGANAELTGSGSLTVTDGYIAGWDIHSTYISDSAAKVFLNSSTSMIAVNGTTFGNAGVQLRWDAGNVSADFHAGNGSDRYFKYENGVLSWEGENTSLDVSGNFSATSATIVGDITADTGYIGGSAFGWIIDTGKITDYGGTIELNSVSGRIDVGSPTVSDGIRIDSGGIELYHSGTKKGEWQIDSEWWLGESTTDRKVSWNPDTNTFAVRGNAAFDTLIWQEVLTTKGRLLIAKSGGELYANCTVTGTTFTVDVKEPTSGGAPFQSGDILKLDNGTNETWFTVGSGSDQGAYYRYTGTYQSGSSSTTYYEGAGVVDFGQSGDGYLEMVADPTGGEDVRYSVLTHAGAPWSTTTELVRSGNLNGYLGVSSDEYGFAAGSNSGTNPNIIISPTYGIKLRRGSTTSAHFDTDGTFEIYGDANNQISWNGSSLAIKGVVTIQSGSTGIGDFSDAGPLVDATNLDDVPDGVTYSKATYNHLIGATRAYNGLDGSYNVVTSVKPAVNIGADPNATGLFLGADYMGYYDDTAEEWKVAILNDGSFLFKGDTSNYVEWDGADLTVRGTLNADDISAGTLTGRKIQTAASGARVVMDDGSTYGLVGYNAADDAIFRFYLGGTYAGDVIIGNPGDGGEGHIWWDDSASELKIRGTLNASDISAGTVSGDYITGGTITGTTIQTSASGQRIVMSQSDNRFSMYNATGEMVSIDTDFDSFFSNMPGGFYTDPGMGFKSQGDDVALYMAGDGGSNLPYILLADDEDFGTISELSVLSQEALQLYRNAQTRNVITASASGVYLRSEEQNTTSPTSRTVYLPIDEDNNFSGYLPVSPDGSDTEPCKNLDTQGVRSKFVKVTYQANYMSQHTIVRLPEDTMIWDMKLYVGQGWNSTTCTIDVGYDRNVGTDDLDFFVNDLDIKTTGWKTLTNTTYLSASGVGYTDIEVGFTRTGTPTQGYFYIWVLYSTLTETIDS